MNRTFYIVGIWCTIIALAACGNTKSKSDSATALASIPEAVYLRLLAECDYVDIIFFDNPVSMSQNDDAGIQNTLSFVSKQVATHIPECQPLGRISYMIQGEIIAEGDFYCSEGCTYILFMEDNKPKYANVLSPSGIQFFRNILLQIQKQLEVQ